MRYKVYDEEDKKERTLEECITPLQVGDKVKVICHSGAKSINTYYGEVIKKTPKGKVDVKYTLEIVNRFDTSGRDVNSPYCGNHYVEIENM